MDSQQTAHSFYTLALFYYGAKETDKALKHMYKSLYIFNLIAGENVITNIIFMILIVIDLH
jgi:hypothetical protein